LCSYASHPLGSASRLSVRLFSVFALIGRFLGMALWSLLTFLVMFTKPVHVRFTAHLHAVYAKTVDRESLRHMAVLAR
jgi:hypothetical protein